MVNKICTCKDAAYLNDFVRQLRTELRDLTGTELLQLRDAEMMSTTQQQLSTTHTSAHSIN